MQALLGLPARLALVAVSVAGRLFVALQKHPLLCAVLVVVARPASMPLVIHEQLTFLTRSPPDI